MALPDSINVKVVQSNVLTVKASDAGLAPTQPPFVLRENLGTVLRPRPFIIDTVTTAVPNVDVFDKYFITGLQTAVAFAAPTGTPTDGQLLLVRIKDNGTPKSISWNSVYRQSLSLALPLATTGRTIQIGFMYNGVDIKWDLLAVLDGF